MKDNSGLLGSDGMGVNFSVAQLETIFTTGSPTPVNSQCTLA
ncbi:hypothetical protein QNI19_36040 [Cytophagaceae bacterium DM2B3-1]|uniref:Uncharacterized protein n=1 Tax=Xanthocytophaga flava TaxID=3048013 RepID=A0ABT7CXD0_9BACT|nr:hypothetical protein [Xanthocytophaga flavus]MDJ1498402.1 hypothetical protein [Xanthocytophaga flavus]